MLTLFSAVVTFGCNFSAKAQSVVPDPMQDFLRQSDSTIRQPIETPKSILQMSINVAGHGKPCVFLTLPTFYTKGGGYGWDVYVPVQGGYVKALPGADGSAITCYPDRIYVGQISEVGVRRGIVTFTISHGSGGIDAYWLKGTKMVHKEILVFPFPEEAGNPDGSVTTVPMLLKYFRASPNPTRRERTCLATLRSMTCAHAATLSPKHTRIRAKHLFLRLLVKPKSTKLGALSHKIEVFRDEAWFPLCDAPVPKTFLFDLSVPS